VDDPVAKYLPGTGQSQGLRTESRPKLTLRHLLTHTSGMAEATPQESKAARKLADLIPRYAEKSPCNSSREPSGSIVSQNQLAGRIVEVVSGIVPGVPAETSVSIRST